MHFTAGIMLDGNNIPLTIIDPTALLKMTPLILSKAERTGKKARRSETGVGGILYTLLKKM